MTDDEKRQKLLALKPGEIVEVLIGNKRGWVRARVTHVLDYGNNETYLNVRPIDLTTSGFTRPRRTHRIRQKTPDVRPPEEVSDADRLTGNVFADLLDENRFHEAAAFLRRMIPFAPKED